MCVCVSVCIHTQSSIHMYTFSFYQLRAYKIDGTPVATSKIRTHISISNIIHSVKEINVLETLADYSTGTGNTIQA